VTELDFQYASLPPETIRFLEEVMPALAEDEPDKNGSANGMTKAFDCKSGKR